MVFLAAAGYPSRRLTVKVQGFGAGTTIARIWHPPPPLRVRSATNGVIAGFFIDAAGNKHGFTYSSGVFKTINFPGVTSTEVHGINKYGTLVGLYTISPTGAATGFTRYDTGTFGRIAFPGLRAQLWMTLTIWATVPGGAVLAQSEPGFLRICR